MWKAIAVSAAVLVGILVLSTARNGHPGLDPRDQLMFERQRAAQRQTLMASKPAVDPILSCAASRAQEATVQTLYLVWINHREDLAPTQDRDDATNDLARSIAACGGDADAAENQSHQRGIDLGQAAALAMLQAGR